MTRIKHLVVAVAVLTAVVQIPASGQVCQGHWSQDFITTGMPTAWEWMKFAALDDGNGPALFASGHDRKWNFNRWEPIGIKMVRAPVIADVAEGRSLFGYFDNNTVGGLFRWDGEQLVPVAVLPSDRGCDEEWHPTSPFVHVQDNGGTWYVPQWKDACHGGIFYHRVERWTSVGWGPTTVSFTPSVMVAGKEFLFMSVFPSMYCDPNSVAMMNWASGEVKWRGEFMSAGCSADIEALQVFDNGLGGEELYVGGDFVTINGQPIEGIAKWDGLKWSQVGDGITGEVYSIEPWNHNGIDMLIVGGKFTQAGPHQVSNLAIWDGTNWHPFDTGVSGDVRDITISEFPWRRSVFFSPSFAEWVCYDCRANCDDSTGQGVLDIFDFLCFQNAFVSEEAYACDCDMTTGPGVCDIFDFICFQDAFVAGCP